MHFHVPVKTLFVRGDADPPHELREIVHAGSTEVDEVRGADAPPTRDADRVVVWNGTTVTVDDRRLRWPDDEDELRLLFQTSG
jgi:hypothetical protein